MKASLVAALSFFVLGCSKLEQIAECRELVRVVNESANALDPLNQQPDSPEKFEALAKRYRELSRTVEALPIARGRAQAEIKEYAEALTSVAQVSEQLSQALHAGASLDAQRKELERAQRRERLGAHRLDSLCQAP